MRTNYVGDAMQAVPTLIETGGRDKDGTGGMGGVGLIVLVLILLFILMKDGFGGGRLDSANCYDFNAHNAGAQSSAVQTAVMQNTVNNADLRDLIQTNLAKTTEVENNAISRELNDAAQENTRLYIDNTTLKAQLYTDAKFANLTAQNAATQTQLQLLACQGKSQFDGVLYATDNQTHALQTQSYAEFNKLQSEIALKPNYPVPVANCCIPVGRPTCGGETRAI